MIDLCCVYCNCCELQVRPYKRRQRQGQKKTGPGPAGPPKPAIVERRPKGEIRRLSTAQLVSKGRPSSARNLCWPHPDKSASRHWRITLSLVRAVHAVDCTSMHRAGDVHARTANGAPPQSSTTSCPASTAGKLLGGCVLGLADYLQASLPACQPPCHR